MVLRRKLDFQSLFRNEVDIENVQFFVNFVIQGGVSYKDETDKIRKLKSISIKHSYNNI